MCKDFQCSLTKLYCKESFTREFNLEVIPQLMNTRFKGSGFYEIDIFQLCILR